MNGESRSITKFKKGLQAEYKDKGYICMRSVPLEGKKTWFVVDLVAVKGKEQIAIEIGDKKDSEKTKLMQEEFTDLRVIPFISTSSEGFLKHICGFVWKPRIGRPKACPACKIHINWESEDEEDY